MPITYVQGDPLLTRATHLAIGHNAKGRSELGAFETEAMRRYPVAFSAYTRKARRGQRQVGELFLWSQTTPTLAFLVVRASSVGATRLRHVQSVLVTLARDYQLYGITSLAIAPLGNQTERPEIRTLYDYWLGSSDLPVAIYEDYLPDAQANEGF